MESDGTVILEAQKRQNLFIFENAINSCLSAQISSSHLWHNRFGHLNFGSLNKMIKVNSVKGIKSKLNSGNVCEICAKSKVCVKKFPKASENRATEVLALVHTDICGPMNIESIGGARYFVTFLDDRSRYMFVYFLKSRDEILDKFKEFKSFLENQSGKNLKALRSDNGREYLSGAFEQLLVNSGIKRQLTVPHTPQQNGVAERANRTLVEMARSMLLHAGLPERFWAEAIKTASYLRNRAETSTLPNMTPFEVWAGRKPFVGHLRVFGAKTIALDKTCKRKFTPKGVEHIMVGYSETAKAYRLYNPDKQRVVEARDVIFIEEDLQSTKSSNEDSAATESLIVEFNSYTPAAVCEYSNEISEEAVTEGLLNTLADEQQQDVTPEGYHQSDTRDISRRGPGRPKIIHTGLPGRPRKQYQMLNVLSTDIAVPSSLDEALSSPLGDK